MMMLLRGILTLTLACAAFAQGGSSPSLQQALSANNASLSSLNSLLSTLPSQVLDRINNATNITLLAPNNDALSTFLNASSTRSLVASDPGLVPAIITYHVLNGTYYASNFSSGGMAGSSMSSNSSSMSKASTSLFIPTHLTNESYSNVTGGQRVEAVASGSNVSFYSALKENSSVVQANVNFTGGVIHIIDRVLSVPQNVTETLRGANLTAALGALQQADVVRPLSRARDVTLFAPNNDAFARIGSLDSGNRTSSSLLKSVVDYHVVEGRVLYSDMLTNETLRTLGNNTDISVSVLNGTVFVNNARVVIQDILMSNGVVHVLDNVLNPSNTTASPNPTATPPPAFSGASSLSNNPFTSGVSGPTSTAPAATSANPGVPAASSTSTQGMAAPACTGAVGIAALFGAGAVVFHL